MYGLQLFTIIGPIDKQGQSCFTEISSTFFGAKQGFGFFRKNKSVGKVQWYLLEEAVTMEQIDKKINSKLEKLGLFLRLSSDYQVFKVSTIHYFQTKDEVFENNHFHFDKIFQSVDQESFKRYIEDPITQIEKEFLDGLHKFSSDVKSFAEIVDYYEILKGTRTDFHCLRNCLSHLDLKYAGENKNEVNKNFPNEFEFKGVEFLRDSVKNKTALEMKLKDILLDLKPLLIDKINQY